MSESTPGSPTEHLLTSSFTCSYSSLFERTDQTETVWVVFHGIGYLSRYFLRHFSHLDPVRNYVLAPQAPSLYYLNDTYTHVGASWLTREETRRNMENLLAMLDRLYAAEHLDKAPRLVLFGYSQGVSVLTRWVAQSRIGCNRMVLYAGKLPDELGPEHFAHLPTGTPVELLYGNSDPYLERWDKSKQEQHAREVFGDRLSWKYYQGGHELLRELIAD